MTRVDKFLIDAVGKAIKAGGGKAATALYDTYGQPGRYHEALEKTLEQQDRDKIGK